MDEIKELIEVARGKGAKANKAAAQIIALGSVAAPAVIEEVRNSPLDRIRIFTGILLQMTDPNIVPLMATLLNEENVDLKLTAYEALGRLKDARALYPLLDRLSDTNSSEFTRSLAARALGELSASQAQVGLLKVAHEILGSTIKQTSLEQFIVSAREEYDEDRLRLALEITVALAKLGDHQLLPVATSILSYRSGEEDSDEDDIIRAEAARALQYVVGPGAFPALQIALHGRSPEVKQEAIDAIFYLGVKEAITELILLTTDAYEDIAGKAFVSIYALTGEWPNGKDAVEEIQIEELQNWWSQRQCKFDSDVCYRLGQPLWLSNVIALLKDSNQPSQITKELQIITGQDFSSDLFVESEEQRKTAFDKAQAWFEANKNRFEAGQLYKYGYKQSLKNIS
jgi:HEAT repeat protein